MPDLNQQTSLLDVGTLTGPVLVFGGPYSNLQATEAILATARQRDIPPGRVICTGDVVAYCANPVETIAAIRDAGIHVVMGNCEESLGFQMDDCGCGFEEDTDCDILSRQWYAYSDRLINDNDREWMRTRPKRITATIGNRRFTFVHGSATDISGWVFGSTDANVKLSNIESLERETGTCDAVVGGHCGIPFIHELPGDKLWMNAGVVGMPANDGTRRGWFAIVEEVNGQVRISLEDLNFDSKAAADAMTQAKLADAYAKSLLSGLWPNMDVLPTLEKTSQGTALGPQTLIWPASSQNAA